MRLFHKSRNKNPDKIQSFFNRYSYLIKWILWFSISFYFFSSFLNPTTQISKTTFSKSKPSLALIENPSPQIQNPNNLFNGLKLYIYDLPPKYNEDWLANPRCKSHLFASEVAIHQALLKSHEVTN